MQLDMLEAPKVSRYVPPGHAVLKYGKVGEHRKDEEAVTNH
jgi:hypothetical protein